MTVRAAMEKSLRDQLQCKPGYDLPADFIGYRIGRKDSLLYAEMSNYIYRRTRCHFQTVPGPS